MLSFVYESVRWLLANGKEKEAIHIIWKAGAINGANPEAIASVISCHANREEIADDGNFPTEPETKSDDEIEEDVMDIGEPTHNSSTNVPITALFTHPRLRKISLVMLLTWSVCVATF